MWLPRMESPHPGVMNAKEIPLWHFLLWHSWIYRDIFYLVGFSFLECSGQTKCVVCHYVTALQWVIRSKWCSWLFYFLQVRPMGLCSSLCSPLFAPAFAMASPIRNSPTVIFFLRNPAHLLLGCTDFLRCGILITRHFEIIHEQVYPAAVIWVVEKIRWKGFKCTETESLLCCSSFVRWSSL